MSLKVTELKNGFFISTIKPTSDSGLASAYETMVLSHESFLEVPGLTNHNWNRKSALQYHRRLAKRLTNRILVKGANDDPFYF